MNAAWIAQHLWPYVAVLPDRYAEGLLVLIGAVALAGLIGTWIAFWMRAVNACAAS